MTDIAIKLVREPVSSLAHARSAELFNVTGKGIYNRSFRHEVVSFAGQCCDVWYVHLHLSAVPTVIAEAAIGAAPITLDVVIGDVINVDYRDYMILAQRHGDPVLVPIKFIRQLTAAGVIKDA